MRYLAVILAIFFIGCGSTPSIIGTWTTVPEGKPTWDRWTFRDDKTLEYRMHIEGRGRIYEDVSVGRYTIDGDELTMDLEKPVVVKLVNRNPSPPGQANHANYKIQIIRADSFRIYNDIGGPADFARVK